MRTFETLSQEDYDLLGQAFVRLKSTGLMIDMIPYDDFIDAVVARGEYADTSEDYVYEETL